MDFGSRFGLAAACASALFSIAAAQGTRRVSTDSGGSQGNGPSAIYGLSISADGQSVAFRSYASNLVPGDTNDTADVFVHDLLSGQTTRVSLDSNGVEENNFCLNPAISAQGRFVAFSSCATNLVPGDTNGRFDVFVHDRTTGGTTRVSVDSNGIQGNDSSDLPTISADGRFVAFQSLASNLVAGDTNGGVDVFLHDATTGQTVRVSVDSSGNQGNGSSQNASMTPDGRFVAFDSTASDLVPGDSNASIDVFVRDLALGVTTRVSVGANGVQGNGHSQHPSMTPDGRFVAFDSAATNLVSGDGNGAWDVFVRDTATGQTECVSVSSAGGPGNGDSSGPSISTDGRFVLFYSTANNLVPDDTNGVGDVFVRDRLTGTTQRVSVDSNGRQAIADQGSSGLSGDGRIAVFASLSANLVIGDTNQTWDAFVHDLHPTAFTSLCDPGLGGTQACPCANPPSGPGRGCDNSSSTGGSVLSASGSALLSSDGLWFTTTGEKPSALSIVAQGTATNAAGAVFGMGVRCTAGTFKRLYTKSAVAGCITAPDFAAGDPAVSARSASLGDTILPGDSRWYFVYYRDPTVLGGCPPTSTFNCTQSGRVDWSP